MTESAYDRAAARVADRLGRHANADGGFDDVVETYMGPNGERGTALELSELGGEIPSWLASGESSIPHAIFAEMESLLAETSDNLDRKMIEDACLEALEGLDAELLQIASTDRRRFVSLTHQVSEMMGDRSKRLWSRFRAASQED